MESDSVPSSAAAETRPRLLSVDALRGFDMFWIIGADDLVYALEEMGSAGFLGILTAQLHHKDWAGFAFYDLIFPMFVFIVGVAMTFSLGRIVAAEGKLGAYKRLFRRFLLLFVIALLYSGGVSREWPDIRLLGVLNRIALCYLFAGLIFCNCQWRGIAAFATGFLVLYWALMTFVPVPGLGAGSFAKGANLANYLDTQFLPGKRWDGAWDPEGLLSTIPAISTCLIGVLAGLLLQNKAMDDRRKVAWLLAGGAIGVACGFLWGLQFPVIKKIWTSSYVLVAGGYSCILLGLFYLVIDVWKKRTWATVFIWIGMNSITIYLLNNIVDMRRFASRFAGGDVKKFFDHAVTHGFGELIIALLALTISILICRWLYMRKIFLRL